jgi:hypothetical protein
MLGIRVINKILFIFLLWLPSRVSHHKKTKDCINNDLETLIHIINRYKWSIIIIQVKSEWDICIELAKNNFPEYQYRYR